MWNFNIGNLKSFLMYYCYLFSVLFLGQESMYTLKYWLSCRTGNIFWLLWNYLEGFKKKIVYILSFEYIFPTNITIPQIFYFFTFFGIFPWLSPWSITINFHITNKIHSTSLTFCDFEVNTLLWLNCTFYIWRRQLKNAIFYFRNSPTFCFFCQKSGRDLFSAVNKYC